MKNITLYFLCLLLLLFAGCIKEEEEQQALPPQKVTVYQTVASDVPIFQEFVGQVFGFKDIAIAARVEGYLEGIHFEEGTQVTKGSLLYTLESQQFEAQVAAKMSGVAAAKTFTTEAKTYLDRIKPLAVEKAVSQSDLDSAQAQYDVGLSQIKAAEANLRAAKIQLGYTKIYSPISGIIGRTKAKVGDFVGRSPSPIILNTVSRIDTVLVQFFITETQYLTLMRRYGKKIDEPDDKKEKANLELILSDGSVYKHKGSGDFVNREVDPTTGAMLVQASFPNPEELLRPGQFARLVGEVEVVKDGILIPQRCVIEMQGTFSVYVVGPENKIQAKEIKAGPKIGEFWLIKEGLKPGEKVVYEGLQKVQDGMVVEPAVKEIPLPEMKKS
jgi:membrane fusion protein (multidrug efflux system)